MCDEESLDLFFYDSNGTLLHTLPAPHPPQGALFVSTYSVKARSLCLPGSIDDALTSVAASATHQEDESTVPGFLHPLSDGTWRFKPTMEAPASPDAYDAEALMTSMPVVTADGTLWWLHEEETTVTLRSSTKKAVRLRLPADEPATLYGLELRLGRGGRPVVMRGSTFYDEHGRTTSDPGILDSPGALEDDVVLPPSQYYDDGAAYRTKRRLIIFSTRGRESGDPKIMWRWDGKGTPQRLFEFDYHQTFVRLAARPEGDTEVHGD